ncbi:G2/mitotic-specific cyclin [Podila humilis]|nr:G2/mitotic-specific cyclin [Podila humilis]
MSQPVQRARGTVAVKREVNENEISRQLQQQPAVQYVKDVHTAVAGASSRGTNANIHTASRKRILGEKTNSVVATDKENAKSGRSGSGSGSKSVASRHELTVKQDPKEATLQQLHPTQKAPLATKLIPRANGAAPREVLQPSRTHHPIKVEQPLVPIHQGQSSKPEVRHPAGKRSRDNVEKDTWEGDQGAAIVVREKHRVDPTPHQPGHVLEVKRPVARRVKYEVKELEPDLMVDIGLPSWEDLDQEDEGDPLMVAEYVTEIFEYMLEQERATQPVPDYMDTQRELAWEMRAVLVDWLAEVHQKFKLLPETLFLCVNILDRFLSERGVSFLKLQLVGITCLFIASKYEEIIAPSVVNFVYMSDGASTEAEILNAEKYILTVLQFQLSYPSPLNFLRRISKGDNYDLHTRTLAKYLMEIPLLDYRLLCFPPSHTAAASMCLARIMMGHFDWDENLVHYSGYHYDDIELCMTLMKGTLCDPDHYETFIFKKFSSKRYMRASIFARQWIRNELRKQALANIRRMQR